MSSENTSVLFRHPWPRLPRTELRSFFDDMVRRVAHGREITCLVTDDRELRRLNREFRGKDYATDVLSFPSGLVRARLLTRAVQKAVQNRGRKPVSGEIAISADRAAAQADEHGHSPADEIRILMLHGVLHLAGMDHETDSGEMAAAETRWRRRLGLPSGLIERAQA
jgi:probable rRNA maturation factor